MNTSASRSFKADLIYIEEFGDPFDELEEQEQDHRRQGSMGA